VNRALRAGELPSASSRIIHPLFVAEPATQDCTLLVTVQPFTYAFTVVFVHGAAPIVMASVRVAFDGLLMVVPNGWLFHVMAASVHADVDAKMSSVRHAAGTAVVNRRRVASLTVAVEGMTGEQRVRSNRMYTRRFWLGPDCESRSMADPLLVEAAFWST